MDCLDDRQGCPLDFPTHANGLCAILRHVRQVAIRHHLCALLLDGLEAATLFRSPKVETWVNSPSLIVLGIVPSPGKGSQWRNATGKTWGMPLVGIWSTGEPVVSSEDDEQDNSDI